MNSTLEKFNPADVPIIDSAQTQLKPHTDETKLNFGKVQLRADCRLDANFSKVVTNRTRSELNFGKV